MAPSKQYAHKLKLRLDYQANKKENPISIFKFPPGRPVKIKGKYRRKNKDAQPVESPPMEECASVRGTVGGPESHSAYDQNSPPTDLLNSCLPVAVANLDGATTSENLNGECDSPGQLENEENEERNLENTGSHSAFDQNSPPTNLLNSFVFANASLKFMAVSDLDSESDSPGQMENEERNLEEVEGKKKMPKNEIRQKLLRFERHRPKKQPAEIITTYHYKPPPGLENKKGAKQQKFIQQVEKQVKFGNNPRTAETGSKIICKITKKKKKSIKKKANPDPAYYPGRNILKNKPQKQIRAKKCQKFLKIAEEFPEEETIDELCYINPVYSYLGLQPKINPTIAGIFEPYTNLSSVQKLLSGHDLSDLEETFADRDLLPD